MDGIKKTLQVLAKSRNRAASKVLDAALVSSNEGIRTGAASEIIRSRSGRNLLELLRVFDKLDDHSKAAISEHSDRLAGAIRMGMFSSEAILQQNSIRAAIELKVFDVIPLLLNLLLEHGGGLKTGIPIVNVMMQLVGLFLDDIKRNPAHKYRQNVQLRDIAAVLYKGVSNFSRTDNSLLLKVLLSLYAYLPNLGAELKDLFRNPNNPAYPVLSKLLLEENEHYIFQFVAETLDLREAPGMVIAAVTKRIDMPFLQALLSRITGSPSAEMRENLSRVHRFEWAPKARSIIVQLDEPQQVALVELISNTSISDLEALNILRLMVLYGRPGGREAAVSELSTHPGSEGDELVLQATEDEDPEVQAAAVRQLRSRKDPKAMIRLIRLAESPHSVVQEAVKQALPEFRIDRFLSMFEQMSEEQRKMSFRLVRKLDNKAGDYLKRELMYGSLENKVRAIRCIEMGDVVPLFEEQLCSVMLESESVPIRVKAAQLLAQGQREVSRNSLLQAVHKDTSLDVRLSAKASYEARQRH